MKALNTIVSLALVLCMVFAFAACAPQTDKPAVSESPAATEASVATEAPADESAEASQPAKEPEAAGGTLKMATNAAFPPYEFYEGQEIVGIDAEIAKLIADKLGMELKIEDMEFESIITAINSGKVDIGMAGMTVIDERKEAVNFSQSYATGKQVIIVKQDSDIVSKDDFEGKSIGVQLSTTGNLYVTWNYVDTGLAQIERFNKGADAVQALLQGKVDAVVIDNEPAKVLVSENEDLQILETEYVIEEYAIAIAKDNTSLLEQINAALAELTASGDIQAILDKYITAS